MVCKLAISIPLVVIMFCKGLNSLEQKHLSDLREFRIQGLASRIEAPKCVVEDLLNNITANSEWNLTLPKLQGNKTHFHTYDTLFLGYSVIDDQTFSNLSCGIKERVATSYNNFELALPFVSGDQHGLILLAHFTDSDKDVFSPYDSSWKGAYHIDEILEAEDGTITLRQGNDVMILNTQYNSTCREGQHQFIRKEFDEITGKSFTSTNYPLLFDWGCDVFGDEVDFCEILKQNENDLEQAGSNVCAEMTITQQSKRCPATLSILQMTGFFRDKLPYLSAPSKTFEAEWVDREHGAGIVFPCFSV